jgi:DNA-binding PadR family transcriptional regulator
MGKKKLQEDLLPKLTPLEEDILTLLIGKELYGLQIIKAIQEAENRKVSFSSLYPTLHRLEGKGYLEARWGEDTPEERDNARRRYYLATGLGEQALRETQLRRFNLAAWQPA